MAANFRVSFVTDATTLDALTDEVFTMIGDEAVPITIAIPLCEVYRALVNATLTSITEEPEAPRGIPGI